MRQHPRKHRIIQFITTHWLFLFVLFPLIYGVLLWIIAGPFNPYYEGQLGDIPISLSVMFWGLGISFVMAMLVYVVFSQDRGALQKELEATKREMAGLNERMATYEAELETLRRSAERYNQDEVERMLTEQSQQLRMRHENVVARFIVNQKYNGLFAADLFADVRGSSYLQSFENLSGGYSGAKVLLFKRGRSNVPFILKVSDKEEIENEFQKFQKHVRNENAIILPRSPASARPYIWGEYGGLEYSFAGETEYIYFTFSQYFRRCVLGEVAVEVIEQLLEGRVFGHLRANWWSDVRLVELNVLAQYFPFTRKSNDIREELKRTKERNQDQILPYFGDADWEQLLDYIDVPNWSQRMRRGHHRYRMALGVIHGDLNSRNIIISVSPNDPNQVQTIDFIDFSHTGNGLTRTRTEEFAEHLYHEGDLYLGHIADDFFRLEADIKFCQTILRNEREWRQIWLLESLMLHHGLDLPAWSELLAGNAFAEALLRLGLAEADGWAELGNSAMWQADEQHKFLVMWTSVRAIRRSLRAIFSTQNLFPYYVAQLQSCLMMIYWEDERFHNAGLQKLYIAKTAAILCKRLIAFDR